MPREDPDTAMPTIAGLKELASLVKRWGTLHLRWSGGPVADAAPAVDPESGLVLPGLPALPLTPPEWWTLPLEDWLARQLSTPIDADPSLRPWVLVGTDMGVDADGHPLLGHVRPMGWIGESAIDAAASRRRDRSGVDALAS
jgi:hypothetical protein